MPPPHTYVFLGAPFVGLPPGTIGNAHAQVRDATGHILKDSVRWRSSHPEFVDVKPTGPSTADLFYRRPGRAVLTASAAGASAATILYTGPIPAATSIRVLPERASIRPDDMIRLKVFPYDSAKQLKPSMWARWSWSDSSLVLFVAAPDYGELVLAALKPGCVRVTATLDAIKATSLVKIGFPGNCSMEKSPRSLAFAPRANTIRASGHSPSANDSALARSLGSEARAIIRDLPNPAPWPPGPGSVGDLLVALQVRAGDLAGALESARTLRLSIFPYLRIAERQRETGDTSGLLATIDASPDRTQATISVAADYGVHDSLDRGIALVRRLSKPSDLADGLRFMAYYAAGRHRERAESLLREVVSIANIANADSGARRELGEVARIRLSMGDWDAAATFVAAAPTPEERVNRLLAFSDEIRDHDMAKSDSLARLAYAAARQIDDSALRARTHQALNGRLGGLVGGSMVTRTQLLVSEAQTVDERASALRLLARSEAMRGQNLTAALATVATLESIAPPRTVANVLVEVVSDDANSPRPEPGRLPALERAVTLGDAVDSAFADSIRSRAVGVIVRFDPGAGVAIAAGIRSPRTREQAIGTIVRREIELNVSSPLDTAGSMSSQPFADSIYALIARRQAGNGLDLRRSGRLRVLPLPACGRWRYRRSERLLTQVPIRLCPGRIFVKHSNCSIHRSIMRRSRPRRSQR